MRLIETAECVAEGAAWLSQACPRMAHAQSLTGPLPLRRRPDGFAALLSIIMGQQVSTASADAIWARLEAAGLTSAEALRGRTSDELRALGLSRQKARYALALAEADLDFESLRRCGDAEVIAQLVKLPGVGPWTAEVYAMFALGRADVFAPGDLALQEAARLLYDLPERPPAKALREMAEAWSPWRAVAARQLWAYYRVARQREGIR